MQGIVIIAQIAIAFVLLNVWLIRQGKATRWRGGDAKNMREEFATYGLPLWFMHTVMFLKVSLAILLVVSIWIPGLAQITAFGIASLMLGAVSMHVKVKDPLPKSLPAFTLLVLSLVVGVF